MPSSARGSCYAAASTESPSQGAKPDRPSAAFALFAPRHQQSSCPPTTPKLPSAWPADRRRAWTARHDGASRHRMKANCPRKRSIARPGPGSRVEQLSAVLPSGVPRGEGRFLFTGGHTGRRRHHTWTHVVYAREEETGKGPRGGRTRLLLAEEALGQEKPADTARGRTRHTAVSTDTRGQAWRRERVTRHERRPQRLINFTKR